MQISDINTKIKKEICFITIDYLKDENLIEEYKNCDSVKKEIKCLKNVLEKNEIPNEKINNILNDYILSLIPAGTKGVIRGKKFNEIVKQKIISFNLDEKEYDVVFEKKHHIFETEEIPDWYVYNKNTNKILIGMNQLDIWGGGQQLNRGYKYIFNEK